MEPARFCGVWHNPDKHGLGDASCARRPGHTGPHQGLGAYIELPCPHCGRHRIEMVLFRDEDLNHQHTRYVCTYWGRGHERCGWEGWTVPGWDHEDAPGRHRLTVRERP